MNVVRDDDDGLAGTEDFIPFRVGRRSALEVELALELLEVVEILEILRRADFEQQKRITGSGGTQCPHAHAVRFAPDLLKILNHLVVTNQLFVRSDAEP